MTVEELLQKLTELAMRGRGGWKVLRLNLDDGHDYETAEWELVCYDDRKEVVIE